MELDLQERVLKPVGVWEIAAHLQQTQAQKHHQQQANLMVGVDEFGMEFLASYLDVDAAKRLTVNRSQL